MKLNKYLRTLLILIVLGSNIGCDQVSKNIARQSLQYNEQIGYFNNYLMLIKVENAGAFLSLGDSLPQPLRSLLLTLMPIAALAFALIYLFAKKDLSTTAVTGICFVIGGGIGNIYDRIVYGSVTDFLHMDFGIFRTGIFNMADVSVMIGTLLVLVELYFQPEANKETSDLG